MNLLKDKKLLLLDRDGVLNELVYRDQRWRAPIRVDEIKFCKGAAEFVSKVKEKFHIVVITNQPDFCGAEILQNPALEIHAEIMNHFGITTSLMCTHKHQVCHCRKPDTGMIKISMAMYNVQPTQTILIGDRWTDIMAARNAGISSILVTRDYEESFAPTSVGKTPPTKLRPDLIISTLAEL
jgi:D-glycero-D-manno-heptose 1,7-bisphosphate phosphatase